MIFKLDENLNFIMFLTLLLIIPIIGIFIISSLTSYEGSNYNVTFYKKIALVTSSVNMILSFIVYIFFNSSTNQFQFVQEHYNVQLFDIYLGLDGISIYFVLLTTIIIPIALLSN